LQGPIRRVLLASAAIPGAFPPSTIEVTLDGKTYQEMHVDGGAFAQTFLYPSALTRNRAQRKRTGQPVVKARAFIIRNGRLDPEWAAAERRTLGIAGRAISTMMSRHAGPAPISRRLRSTPPRSCVRGPAPDAGTDRPITVTIWRRVEFSAVPQSSGDGYGPVDLRYLPGKEGGIDQQ
jgi:hypothetical protein